MIDAIKNFLGLEDKAVKKSGRSPAKTAAKTAVKKSAQPKTELRRRNADPSNKKARPTVKTLLTREDIPAYVELLSGGSGCQYVYSTEMLARYAVLLPKKNVKRVLIVCLKPKGGAARTVDKGYLSIKSRCEKDGYKTSRCLASEEIISIIYESGEIQQSKQDALKKASQLQNDFTKLIGQAVAMGVSDIHIEVRKDTAIVKFRRDGLLGKIKEWSVTYARKMAVVIYMVIAEKKETTFFEGVAQDASIELDIETGQTIRIRLSTLPTAPQGFDMIMRVLELDSGNGAMSLPALGYLERQCDAINRGLSKPVGVTIFAGTTGSGKTTSLTAILESMIADSHGEIKVITVENPPENVILGATQVPVMNSNSGGSEGNTFAKTIKATMRCDPDVLMVGEVRDEESADLLVKATQTGHKVLSTIHATSAIGIISRLRMIKVDNGILGSMDFIATLIYQALVPKVCVHCSIPITVKSKDADEKTKEIIERVMAVGGDQDIEKVKFRHKKGCSKCNKGIKGRIVVAEVINPTREMLRHFQAGDDSLAWDAFVRDGGITALTAGTERMLIGMCDPWDVEAKLGRLDSNSELSDKDD